MTGLPSGEAYETVEFKKSDPIPGVRGSKPPEFSVIPFLGQVQELFIHLLATIMLVRVA